MSDTEPRPGVCLSAERGREKFSLDASPFRPLVSNCHDTERVCWVVTGAGHFLRETAELLEALAARLEVDLFFTRAAREVAARYGVRERLEASAARFFDEGDYSAGQSVYFFSGRYRALAVAPATANTVAKCALGIADSLASNFFAQAGKSGVPILVLPTDGEGAVDSVTPSGRTIRVVPRPIDIQWTRALRDAEKFPNVTVALSAADLASSLARLCLGEHDGRV